MKSAVAYYLLIFYSAALFKPIWPFVKDVLAHTFSKEYHIATIHHEHGDDHTHYEIAKKTEKDTSKEEIVKRYDPVSVHIVSCTTYELFCPADETKVFPPFLRRTGSPYFCIITPPPKA